jgi:hypothetical protein
MSLKRLYLQGVFTLVKKYPCWHLPPMSFYNGVGIYYNGEIFVRFVR